MQKKIALVTGTHGTIGRYIASTLAARNWEVVGIGHGKWDAGDQLKWGINSWHETDVSLASLRNLDIRPTLIVHCAGSGDVGASIIAPHTDFLRTVATTAAVLEFFRVDCPEAVLVYPSSAAVYGIAESFPMRESIPLRPTSPYGAHKKIAEELIMDHARLFGLKAVVIRLFSIYGEGFRKQLLWDACQRILTNETAFFGTGEETRDWLHVADAADLLVQSAYHASACCPVLNGGTGTPVSIRVVLTELFRLMGRSDLPTFCGTQRPGDPLHYHADMRQATAWGWSPQIAWQSGLARYVSWFRQEHGLV
ncbi:NAD-dependent epimerase/dehydratase family protein [uncultured Desulfobulbus sp.]|uniref:NAD-dependent epimerase/dehydratase family protein n=1 Tax=uncultured Desulfobulbus sp. TaxID=239745 RepID=UPI0029C85EA8|nr:NAD-dependent epimerase/dehydratase family protein [uncultured Desulfobulbus sp.]